MSNIFAFFSRMTGTLTDFSITAVQRILINSLNNDISDTFSSVSFSSTSHLDFIPI